MSCSPVRLSTRSHPANLAALRSKAVSALADFSQALSMAV